MFENWESEERAYGSSERVSAVGYMAEPQFWYESLQNWQSEFLAVLAIVLLSIWPRQWGSPSPSRSTPRTAIPAVGSAGELLRAQTRDLEAIAVERRRPRRLAWRRPRRHFRAVRRMGDALAAHDVPRGHAG